MGTFVVVVVVDVLIEARNLIPTIMMTTNDEARNWFLFFDNNISYCPDFFFNPFGCSIIVFFSFWYSIRLLYLGNFHFVLILVFWFDLIFFSFPIDFILLLFTNIDGGKIDRFDTRSSFVHHQAHTRSINKFFFFWWSESNKQNKTKIILSHQFSVVVVVVHYGN